MSFQNFCTCVQVVNKCSNVSGTCMEALFSAFCERASYTILPYCISIILFNTVDKLMANVNLEITSIDKCKQLFSYSVA